MAARKRGLGWASVVTRQDSPGNWGRLCAASLRAALRGSGVVWERDASLCMRVSLSVSLSA